MSLQTRLLLAIGYVLLVAVVAFEVPLAINTGNRTDSEVRAQASAQVDLLAVAAAEEFSEGPAQLRPLVDVSARTVVGRVLIVDERGRLVVDSEGERRGVDFTNRPEIREALAGSKVQQRRESESLGQEIIATAAPLRLNDRIIGAVRITQSTAAEGRASRESVLGLILIGVVVMGIGLIAAVVVARGLAGPVRSLTAASERIAAGDLDQRAPVEGSAEQRRLAHSFNEMTERLSRLLESQRRFVADASHQLRTPLTGVRLRLEEAEAAIQQADGEAGAASEARRELAAAIGEVDRLSGIVDEMLVLSRLGQSGVEPTDVSLADVVSRAAERWGPEATRRASAIVVDPGNGETVRCVPEDLDRCLDALIENALLYAPDGSTVRLAARERRIAVVDEGPGLDAGEPEQVFERFHRGRAGREGPRGSGLGLSIARGMAQGWGGDVTLENRGDGPGAVARIVFPEPGRAGDRGSLR